MESNLSYKRVFITILAAAVCLTAMPMLAFGQQDTDRVMALPRDPGTAGFCANIATVRETALAKLGERRAGAGPSGEHEAKKEERLEQLEADRTNRQANRVGQYEKLRDFVTTDEQEVAVETFISTVENLVATRQAAVDTAIASFEAAATELLEDKQAAVATYAGAIEVDMNAIFDEAQESCDSEVSGKEVQQQVRTAMTALRETIKADREEYSFKGDLEVVRAERKAAIETAMQTFQAGYEAAKADLKGTLR